MFKAFDPDPDITDPTDPDFGTGTWHYADGGSAYGQGDPAEAVKLWQPPAQPDERTANVSPYGQDQQMTPKPAGQEALDANQPQSDVPTRAPIVAEPSGGVAIPKASRIAYVHNNPGNLKYVGQEGAHEGEPAEDGGHWAAFETPEEGVAALNRQIELDSGKGKSVREFISKYAPPGSNDTEQYIRQATADLGVSDDAKLSDIPRDKLLSFVARKESGTELGGSSLPAQEAPRAQSQMPGLPPSSLGGMPASAVEVKGTPMSPDQIRQRQQDIYDSTLTQVQGVQQAAQARQQGRDEAVKMVTDQSERFKADQMAQLAQATTTKAEAQKNVESAMATQLDPGRIIKNMSTGDVVLGVLALALGGLGQTLQQRGGQRNAQNGAVNMLEKAINDDIEQQKDDKKSRVAHWTNVFNDAQMGEKAARAEMWNAAGKLAEFQANTKAQNADIQAQMMQDSATMLANGQKEASGLVDKENERLTIRYQRPDPAAAGALGGIPKLARVGVEDRDPETREALANAYNPDSPTDRSQMTALTKEMQQVTKLEQTLDGLKQWYGAGTDSPDYDSSATGPWWNPGNWADNDEKDRSLRDLWAQVETDTRMGWQTEPNGEVKQSELSGINRPKRDNEAKTKLRDLETEIKRRKEAVMSGTNAPVRAAWKYQNGYPIESQGGGKGRPVTGKIAR